MVKNFYADSRGMGVLMGCLQPCCLEHRRNLQCTEPRWFLLCHEVLGSDPFLGKPHSLAFSEISMEAAE